jgi:hypothetical protein
MSRIQSGMEYQMRPSGRPDEKESNVTESVRHDRIARTRLSRAPGFSVGGTRGVSPRPA